MPVAPSTSTQAPPAASQRCHWYVNASGGLPAQVPGTSVSVWPRYAVPVTFGGASASGGSIACSILPVASEVAEAEPARFVPVSRTRIVPSKSSATSR